MPHGYVLVLALRMQETNRKQLRPGGIVVIPVERVTTGFKGLDDILDGLRFGDNVVWRLDHISDYQYFVTPFVSWR